MREEHGHHGAHPMLERPHPRELLSEEPGQLKREIAEAGVAVLRRARVEGLIQEILESAAK